MISTLSADGTTAIAMEEGSGPAILIVHPGLDDGTAWRKVTDILAREFTVTNIVRRQYRDDIRRRVSIADEVADIAAICGALQRRVLIVGHSSGGVVSLEALAARPDLFVGGVVYEPPVDIGQPIGGESLDHAVQAIAENKPGKAIQIFTRDIVGLPSGQSRMIRVFVGLSSKLKRLAPGQIADNVAMRDLGTRLGAYAGIELPVLLIGGGRSPAHLGERLDVLMQTIRYSERVLLPRQGHSANQRAPREMATVITRFYRDLLVPKKEAH
ncbi:alpha/beta fold hydrolase [Microbacterium sp.]|uniref:alpha/beta fold hydrolase n=1 Tax=Microbacterium sp. TaxID=51671 RepID=UPI003F9A357F